MTGPNFTLFLVCTVIAIAGAVTTVVAQRPLRAAIGLLSNIIALAGLYLTLSAHLLAAIQVLVYAGAVVVLFVFVIMLIGPASEATPEGRSNVGRTVSLAVMGMMTAAVSFSVVGVASEWVALAEGYGSARGVGADLYTKALVPFELVSITLTVAIIGAIALAKTRNKSEVAEAKAVRESILAQRAEEGAAAPRRIVMEIGLGIYLSLGSLLFGIGAIGFLVRRNVLVQLMSIELMLNAVNLVLIASNRFLPENHTGQLFALFVIAIAAAEAAVGLAIVLALYRLRRTVSSDDANLLKH